MSLAFVCHSHHRTTRSSWFLLDALRERHEVEVTWDEEWRTGTPPALDAVLRQPRAVVWQVEETALRLARARHPNVTFFAMFDSCHAKPDSYWRALRSVKVVSFSRTLHERLVALGLHSHLVQFFPDPRSVPVAAPGPGLRGYLWQRRPEITWETVRTLVGDARFERFTLHAAPDPGCAEVRLPSPEDQARHAIELSRWHPTHHAAAEIVAAHGVYFAPRLREGIGMAFLEAMAMGLLVVAPDRPTMSEYIVSGVNGLLYDPARPVALDLSRREELGARARRDVAVGFERFARAWPAVLDLIDADPPRPSSGVLAAARRLVRRIRPGSPPIARSIQEPP